MSDDVRERRLRLASAFLFGAIAILIAADLVIDRQEGAGIVHLAIEGTVLIGAAIGVVLMLRTVSRVSGDLAAAREDAARWRRENQEIVRGLSSAIQKQFDAWRLSAAEAEIGLLLLKGLSHREIADVRQTSERTAREQARALYRKAGLSGRNELSAFFLEDLLTGDGARSP